MSADEFVSDKIDKQAKLRLRSRLARLQRLVELDAPSIILALQCELIGDVGRMLDPVGSYDRDRREYVTRLRRSLDMCSELGCEESLVPECTQAAVLEDNPFLLHRCRAHADQDAAEVIENSDYPGVPGDEEDGDE